MSFIPQKGDNSTKAPRHDSTFAYHGACSLLKYQVRTCFASIRLYQRLSRTIIHSFRSGFFFSVGRIINANCAESGATRIFVCQHPMSCSAGATADRENSRIRIVRTLDIGAVTPYGVVYDNGIERPPLYRGGPFPPYLYDTISWRWKPHRFPNRRTQRIEPFSAFPSLKSLQKYPVRPASPEEAGLFYAQTSEQDEKGAGLARTQEPSEAVRVGRGGARKQAPFSPQAGTKRSGLCLDGDRGEVHHAPS